MTLNDNLLTYYIYDTEAVEHPPYPVVARIHAADNAACERLASEQYGIDRFGGTYVVPQIGSGELEESDQTIDLYDGEDPE